MTYWREVHEGFHERNRMVVDLLDRVFTALNEKKIYRVCVTENFATILLSDSCLSCFCSSDIDLLCLEEDKEVITEVMEDFGFHWADRHKRKKSFAREFKNESAFDTKMGGRWNGFWLNFQFRPATRVKTHLYDQRRIWRRYPSLFEETCQYGNTQIRLFNPEALTYLNCVHIASMHYYILTPDFRLYADIDRVARYCKVDWKKVRQWAEEDRLGIRINTVYKIVGHCLKSPIPAEAYTENKGADDFAATLMDLQTMERKIPKKGIIPNIIFLIRTELKSDGTNMALAFLRRLYVICCTDV